MDNNTEVLKTWQERVLEVPENQQAITGLTNFIQAAWNIKKTPAFAKCCTAVTYLRKRSKEKQETYKGHPLDQVVELHKLLNLGTKHKKTAEEVAKSLLLYCIEHHSDKNAVKCNAPHDPKDYQLKNLERFRDFFVASNNKIAELEAERDRPKIQPAKPCSTCIRLQEDVDYRDSVIKDLQQQLQKHKNLEMNLPKFRDLAMKMVRSGNKDYDTFKEKAGILEQARNNFENLHRSVIDAISSPHLSRDQVLQQVESQFKGFGDQIGAYYRGHIDPERMAVDRYFETAEDVALQEQERLLGKYKTLKEEMDSKPEKKLIQEEMEEKGLLQGSNLTAMKTRSSLKLSEKPLRQDLTKKS